MDVSNEIGNDADVEDRFPNSVSDICSTTNVNTTEASSLVELVKKNCLAGPRSGSVSCSDIKKYHLVRDVPSSPSRSDVYPFTKAVSEEYHGCEDQEYTMLQTSPQDMKDSLLSKDIISLHNDSEEVNNLSGGVCEDRDFLNSDSGNTENVLLELTENCELDSIENNSCIDIERESKLKLENKNNCSESSSDMLTTDDTSFLHDVLLIKDEPGIDIESDKSFDNNDVESKICNEHESQLYDESSKNEDSKVFVEVSNEESHAVAGSNDDSDTISADEKDDNLKLDQNSECKGDNTDLSDKQVQNEDFLSSSMKHNSTTGVAGGILYKCINCSFTDRQLEKLSSHVIACVKKRKQEQNQELHVNGEPPSKVLVLPCDQKSVQSKSQISVTSKTQPDVLQPITAPLSPNSFQIAPHTLLLNPSQSQSAALTKIVNTPKGQIATTSQTQPSGTSKTVLAISPKLVSVTKPQIIINPETQLPVSSPSQKAASTRKQPRTLVKPQISISPKTQLSSMSKKQPVITLQTQLPIMSTSQFTSASSPQVVTSTQSQFSLAAGTKLTLGPHSQVPIVPQAPLTLSSQGLTIAQAGTQLLITTKPVQPSTSSSNQPTLLGLGIGTNPAVAPKNIVLLPNVLLNSLPTSAGKTNGKQTPSPIQGQFILQTTPTVSGSVAPVQLQQNLVYAPHVGQSQVLLVPSNLVSTSAIKNTTRNAILTSAVKATPKSSPISSSTIVTSVPANKRQNKLPLTISAPKLTTNSNSVPTSTTIFKSVPAEKSGPTSKSHDKFICEICDDYVKDLEKLRKHMQCLHAINIHPKMMPSFNCQKCQFCFFTEQGLERHLVGSHGLVTTGMQEAADKGKDGGRCPICGWGYQNKLLHHVATDHKVILKPADLSYKCTICTATFGVYKQFEDHVYSAHRPAISKLAQKSSRKTSAIK